MSSPFLFDVKLLSARILTGIEEAEYEAFGCQFLSQCIISARGKFLCWSSYVYLYGLQELK